MKIIAINKGSFDILQFDDVAIINYDATSKVYSLVYGEEQTVTISGDTYIVRIV